jgi:hypothetical protein
MKRVKFANIDSDKLLEDLSAEEKMKLHTFWLVRAMVTEQPGN